MLLSVAVADTHVSQPACITIQPVCNSRCPWHVWPTRPCDIRQPSHSGIDDIHTNDVLRQGFATGSLDQDAAAPRMFVGRGMEGLFAQSYSKNLGLYAGAQNIQPQTLKLSCAKLLQGAGPARRYAES